MISNLFLLLLLNAIILGIFVFVIQASIRHQLSKNLELRHSRLCEERANAIRDLHASLTEVEDAMIFRFVKGDVYYTDAGLTLMMKDLLHLIGKTRIYLDEKTCSVVDRARYGLFFELASLKNQQTPPDSVSTDQAAVSSSVESIKKKIRPLREAKVKLGAEFRSLLIATQNHSGSRGITASQRIAEEWLYILGGLLFGLLVTYIGWFILSDLDWSLIGSYADDFLVEIFSGREPGWILILAPYLAFQFIRSIIWAITTVKYS